MKFVYGILIIVALASLGLIAAGQAGFLAGKVPRNLGVVDGKLSPPSATPNSVSSQADMYPEHPQKAYSKIAPFTYAGDGDAAMQKLAVVLALSEGTVVVKNETDYLYAQSTTALMRYTDDLEFWLDRANNVIQVRSASRIGKSDLGKNRQRIESIRESFNRALAAR